MNSQNCCVLALVAIVCAGSAPAGADPAGLWRGTGGWTTRIATCGGGYCGFIAGTVPVNDPATGRPQTDKKNADASKRGRPLVGVQVLISMRPNGAARWSGQLYNHEDGKNYSGHLIEQSPNNVRIEGCWLGICGGENLTRVR